MRLSKIKRNAIDYGGKIMSQTIVRLQELEIKNIKNVEYGKVEMPNSYQQKRTYDNSEILGLYGQNGSGKSSARTGIMLFRRNAL